MTAPQTTHGACAKSQNPILAYPIPLAKTARDEFARTVDMLCSLIVTTGQGNVIYAVEQNYGEERVAIALDAIQKCRLWSKRCY